MSQEQKDFLRGNKNHYSSFLKDFQLAEIVSDLRVHLLWSSDKSFLVGECGSLCFVNVQGKALLLDKNLTPSMVHFSLI